MTEIDVADGTYTAVVDAIEDDLARVFFEADGTDVGSALVDEDVLPTEGRHADAILTVTVQDGVLQEIEYKADQTADRKAAAQDRFDRLSNRLSDKEDQ